MPKSSSSVCRGADARVLGRARKNLWCHSIWEVATCSIDTGSRRLFGPMESLEDLSFPVKDSPFSNSSVLLRAFDSSRVYLDLGRVDEFDQAKAGGEADD
jgi:hypothetical protein